MKLFLSSFRIPNLEEFVRFVGKPASKIKFALILNSKDSRTLEYRNDKREELFSYFGNFGFEVSEIDLREYSDAETLENKLKEFDVVWFNGGNTYVLRSSIRKSGGDIAIPNALEAGVVYGGDSAGSIIVGPTLKHYSGADDPSAAENIIYEGLGLVEFSILPHWGSGEHGEILLKIESELQRDGFVTKRLTDEEYLCVETEASKM